MEPSLSSLLLALEPKQLLFIPLWLWSSWNGPFGPFSSPKPVVRIGLGLLLWSKKGKSSIREESEQYFSSDQRLNESSAHEGGTPLVFAGQEGSLPAERRSRPRRLQRHGWAGVSEQLCPSLDPGLFPAAASIIIFTTAQKPAQAANPILGKAPLLTLAFSYWLLWLVFKLVLGKTVTVLFWRCCGKA